MLGATLLLLAAPAAETPPPPATMLTQPAVNQSPPAPRPVDTKPATDLPSPAPPDTAAPPPADPATADLPPASADAVAPPPTEPAVDLPPPATSDAATPPASSTETKAAAPDDLDLELDAAGGTKDPLQGFNRISFKVSMAFDKVLLRPAAMVYRHVVPRPLRDGAHNLLANLGEPFVFLNDMLQLRPKRMVRTLGRFLLNSTLGLVGIFDVAKRKPFHLPHHANSLGDTFGYYGIGPGPYIYIPILGPTTLRDLAGSSEGYISSLVVIHPLDRQAFQISSSVVGGLDQRERADDDLKAMLSDAIDPYATFRANYLQNRAGEIAELKAHDGKPAATPEFNDPLTDPLTVPQAVPQPKQAPQPALPEQSPHPQH